jgi:hypothetical protein
MKQRNISIALAVALMLLVVVGCAAGPNPVAEFPIKAGNPAGFLLGFWHGLIAPFAFVVSLFNSNVGVYEINNVGHWYDFGFLLGAAAAFGGGAKSFNGRKGK